MFSDTSVWIRLKDVVTQQVVGWDSVNEVKKLRIRWLLTDSYVFFANVLNSGHNETDFSPLTDGLLSRCPPTPSHCIGQSNTWKYVFLVYLLYYCEHLGFSKPLNALLQLDLLDGITDATRRIPAKAGLMDTWKCSPQSLKSLVFCARATPALHVML